MLLDSDAPIVAKALENRHQPTFTAEVIAQLRTFLESADLVKFAGQEATTAMADDATARRTIRFNDGPTPIADALAG